MAQPRSSPTSTTLPAGSRLAAVVSGYHEEIGAMMLASARAELLLLGLEPEHLFEVRAPGAFELPLIARRLAVRDDIDAVLCFGLVLKGETTHDEHVAGAAARGILDASLQTDTPLLFGVLTCDTLEQAQARALPSAQGGRFDKGRELARAAAQALAALELAANIGSLERGGGFFRREAGTGGAQ
jgi:6,7-dimethyl-8-ribityllumazine synthase